MIFCNDILILTRNIFIFEEVIFLETSETSFLFAKTFHNVRRKTSRSIINTISRTTKFNVVLLLIELRIFDAIETTDSNNFRDECRCLVDFVLIHFLDIFINVSTMLYELVSNLDILKVFHSIAHCRNDFLFEFIDFNVIIYS